MTMNNAEQHVVSIHIAAEAGGVLNALRSAEIVAGRGIVGDRHCQTEDSSSDAQVSLVEAEQIEAYAGEVGYPLQAYDTRRNIVTRGIALNELVGVRFSIGAVEMIGAELAEPCKYLAGTLIEQFGMTGVEPKDIVAGLVHRAGLYAKVLRGGSIAAGDPIVVIGPG